MNKAEQSKAFYWSLVGLGLSAFVINLLTVVVFVRFRKKLLESNHNRILCSMAVADALVGCFSTSLGALLLTKSPVIAYKLAGNIPLFSSMFVSVMSLTLLTSDRLMAVKKPFIFGSTSYRRGILKCLVVIWVVPGLIIIEQSMVFFFTSKDTELMVRSVFVAVFFTCGAALLIVVNGMLFIGIREYISRIKDREKKSVYGETSFSVKQNSVDISKQNPPRDRLSTVMESHHENTQVCGANNKIDITDRRRKSARLSRGQELKRTSIACILIVVLFILTWIPLSAYRFAFVLGVKLMIAWLRRTALCLTIANSIMNPFIYFLFKKDFRSYFIQMITCRVSYQTEHRGGK